jgi:hypothetical protein
LKKQIEKGTAQQEGEDKWWQKPNKRIDESTATITS